MSARLAATAVLTLVAASHALPRAQSPGAPATTPPDTSARFEVASVKRNAGTDNLIRIGMQPGGRYTATNVTLRQLITQAYRLQDFQLVNEPDWVKTDRFDITAKAEGDIPPTPPGTLGPMQMMVRNLLIDRFKLTAHEEEREMPIYALVLAREDKRLGPKLQASTVDCQALMNAARRGTPPPAPAAVPSANERPTCGVRMGRGQMMGGAFAIGSLPGLLAPIVQRYVVDRTGLKGNFDIDLTYTPDQMTAGGAAAAAAPPVPSDTGGASIYTALQEQLGLKLESQRGPVKVLVIDSVRQPTED